MGITASRLKVLEFNDVDCAVQNKDLGSDAYVKDCSSASDAAVDCSAIMLNNRSSVGAPVCKLFIFGNCLPFQWKTYEVLSVVQYQASVQFSVS